jgi:AraC-like DNA-binding protein
VVKSNEIKTILALDCCEHAIKALESLGYEVLTELPSTQGQPLKLIVTGITQLPLRRTMINDLRRLYPSVPALILRREGTSGKERIRGEFMLSDHANKDDLEVVRHVRSAFPLPACEHTRKSTNYSLAEAALRVLLERYSEVELDLRLVARELVVSPKKLSRVLNQEAGLSFRQLLRNIRVEEAKRMLSSGDYSIKEVAAQVGFSDGHYFSRSFKEVTGQSASEFRALSAPMG